MDSGVQRSRYVSPQPDRSKQSGRSTDRPSSSSSTNQEDGDERNASSITAKSRHLQNYGKIGETAQRRSTEPSDLLATASSGTSKTQDTNGSAIYTDKRDPFTFINRIKKAKDTAALEFVYLNLVKGGIRSLHNPYKLEVVPRANVDSKDYYTMSAQGVMHFVGGEADFTSLDQWIREHSIFHKLHEASFFKQFRVWRALYRWRKSIISNKRNHAIHVLETSLFVLNRQLQMPLLEIRKLCLLITDGMPAISKEIKESTELEQSAEKHKQDEIKTKLRGIYEDIRALVAQALQDSMDANGFGADSLNVAPTNDPEDFGGQPASPAHTGTIGIAGNASPSRNNLAGTQNTEEPFRMTYTALSKKRALCRRLVNFVRLADYMIIDSLAFVDIVTKTKHLLKEKEFKDYIDLVMEDAAQS